LRCTSKSQFDLGLGRLTGPHADRRVQIQHRSFDQAWSLAWQTITAPRAHVASADPRTAAAVGDVERATLPIRCGTCGPNPALTFAAFELRVGATDAIAVRCADTQLSYGELNARTSRHTPIARTGRARRRW
jgi:hypothetical protein